MLRAVECYTQISMKTGDLPLPSPPHRGAGTVIAPVERRFLPRCAYLYPQLSLPEKILGKIFREAGSFPEDACVRVRFGKLVGNGKNV